MTVHAPLPAPADLLTLTAIRDDVAAGRRTVRDVAEATLARIAQLEPQVEAFVHLNPNLLADADAVDAAAKGPLAGVTVGVKDVIATVDMPTAHATLRYEGSRTGVDAACVDVLRQAGALIVGKTVTTEFAADARGGKTRNPHDPSRSPGGSSSGSAAAVAAGMVAVALGTQTGGSTIRPASFCGIYGWKPTWNAISREGLKVYSLTCDTLGLYARNARDLTALADLWDLDPAPEPATLPGLRVGLVRGPAWDRTGPAMRTAVATAADRLRDAGAEVIEITLPAIFDGLPAAHSTILACEGRAAFLNEVRANPALHDNFHAMVANRRAISPAEARAAYVTADAARAAFDEIAAGVDIVMTASACDEAPQGLHWTGDASQNSMWTLLQVPVVSVPGLTGPNGLPLGISFVARRYSDRTALAAARLAGPVLARRGGS